MKKKLSLIALSVDSFQPLPACKMILGGTGTCGGDANGDPTDEPPADPPPPTNN